MYSQLRMMVTQDHHGDEGQPYPSFGSTCGQQISIYRDPHTSTVCDYSITMHKTYSKNA